MTAAIGKPLKVHKVQGRGDAKHMQAVRGLPYRDDQTRFFTIAEVAERLHVATRTVRRWIGARELIVHRIGRTIRIAEGDLRAFLALHREG